MHSLKEVYQYVITRSGSTSRTAHLPKTLTIWGMKICHFLGISPLGPYHYRMIAENFVFDTTRIKEELQWQPSKTNEEILWDAYNYYSAHSQDDFSNQPAHRKPASMGIIKLLKLLS